MSIEQEMYSILKKGSAKPIIFVDMDDTILIRDVDLNFFLVILLHLLSKPGVTLVYQVHF